MIRAALAALILATPALAQEATIVSPIDGTVTVIPDVMADQVRAKTGDGVRLKGLDKVSGDAQDIELALGETGRMGRIEVTLGECRYPEDNPAGEGYAWLTITDPSRQTTLFEGWMSASSPGLNALDHPRYDVWVIRCTTA
ncbi:MAG: DUF2155 domain-containing protein [Silicimonas sp.]|nr:DUF2155 domain-containing protein [Silicimonas sp.]